MMSKAALTWAGTVAALLFSTNGLCAINVQGYQGIQGLRTAAKSECQWRMSGRLFNQLPEAAKLRLVGPCAPQIWIEGELVKADGADFGALVSFFESTQLRKNGQMWWPGIILDSEGGSVLAALEMARAIRASAWVRDYSFTATGDVCYSACVVVLAASYSRLVGGEVGIHRPYFIGEEYRDWGYEDLQEAYDALFTELSRSFSQWNLPMSLVDDMFAVPSSDIRVLTETELGRYGLNREDLVKEEKRLVEMRAICGQVFDAGEMISGEGRACLERINATRYERTVAEYAARLCGKALTSTELEQPENVGCRNAVRQSTGLESVAPGD